MGLSWGFLYAFSGMSVKLGAFCRAWMPGFEVNSVQGGEADQSSPTAVIRPKEERQNLRI